MTAKRFWIQTFGCQMNEHDSERLAGLFSEQGMEPVGSAEEADLIVFNTCCVRENADNKFYGHLGDLKALKRQRPELQIAVGGCLAQKDRELIQQRAGHVDVVFGTHNLAHAVDLLERARLEGPIMEILEEAESFPSALPARRDVDHAAWVTIQIGCDNTCAFCIVPAVRGKEQSRRLGDIVREVEELAGDGVTEVTLLGQNVNSYGRDLGAGQYKPRFADLLRAVDAIPGIRRIRFTSPHPKDLRPETIAAMAECESVCEHLHLPLQAGSDRTLARMHRGYTARRYLERLAAARAAVPELAVTTDLIVGFPGETEEDFAATLEVVEEAGYDAAYTFVFSPRPGTEAAAWVEDFLPADVTAERMQRLTAVVEGSALARHEARVGKVEEVLVEGPSKKDPAMTTGRTRQNKLVHFRAPGTGDAGAGAPALRPGSFAEVKIDSAAPHFLRGSFIRTTADPARRVRIPVQAS
jgi:tRNA-2-methylthio-N6-dimethylallyladenosine synthase